MIFIYCFLCMYFSKLPSLCNKNVFWDKYFHDSKDKAGILFLVLQEK